MIALYIVIPVLVLAGVLFVAFLINRPQPAVTLRQLIADAEKEGPPISTNAKILNNTSYNKKLTNPQLQALDRARLNGAVRAEGENLIVPTIEELDTKWSPRRRRNDHNGQHDSNPPPAS